MDFCHFVTLLYHYVDSTLLARLCVTLIFKIIDALRVEHNTFICDCLIVQPQMH